MVSLEDGDGMWAGVLGLASNLDVDSLPRGEEVQLMEISEGTVSYKELDLSFEEQEDAAALSERHTEPKRNNPLTVSHQANTLYSFVNVLWVEKEGDHFLRKAVGRVEASVWRSLCSEMVKQEVVLG